MAAIANCVLFLLQYIVVYASSDAKPNIVFILTDDQDVFLGGTEPMKKTKKLVGDAGIRFTNMFVTSPICCPSRSSILSGRYIHNGGALNNSISGNCNGLQWQEGLERDTFATHLRSSGYETFFAGKYLNDYGKKRVGGVKHIPPGWDHWNGLVGNSRYYNYTLSVNGEAEKHGDNYQKDYLTDVINRRASKFLEGRGLSGDSNVQPFFMMLSTPACHANFTPAPQYNATYREKQAPRDGSFNVHGNDKHWLIRTATHPMKESSIKFSDDAFRNRWRTLLSVDDMVEDVIHKLDEMDELENTYIVFTSDNGFHLGQFSLPVDKRQIYEFDIRVPLMVRGPGIAAGQSRQEIVLNIDIASTLIDLAGEVVPSRMDGLSFKRFLVPSSGKLQLPWRDQFLLEYHGERHPAIPNCPQYAGDGLADCYPDCVCEDSWNNTYACVRTLNQQKNTVYCVFNDVEHFEEYYDMKQDPYQLENIIDSVDKNVLARQKELIDRLKSCKGVSCQLLGNS